MESGDVLIFPRQIPNEHRVLVIFIEEPLPAGVLDILLARPIDAGSLNYCAVVFQNKLAAGPSRCRMLGRRFLVARGQL
jgi:hypothetical protein